MEPITYSSNEGFDKSKIPLRPSSSISLSLSDLNLNRTLLSDDTKRKRTSMIYNTNIFSTPSRIPIHMSSSNLNNIITNSKSSRRLSTIVNENYPNSKSKENLQPSKVSELSLNDSKIPRSPSTLSIYNKRERHNSMTPLSSTSSNVSRSSNVVPSSKTKSKSIPLKFSYYTESTHKQTREQHNANRLSRIHRSSTVQNIQISKPKKIQTMEELLDMLASDPSNKNKIFNKTGRIGSDDKLPFILYEELSSKKPEMFNKLTMYEKIMQYPEIYFTGNCKENKVKADLKDTRNNYNFDDKMGNFKVILGDHIKYRYEIKEILGKGAFGTVVSVIDHSYKRAPIFGCKIIKNDLKCSLQSIEEIKIMKKVRDHENIVKYIKHFNFRSHMIIIMEILGVSIYEAIKINKFNGFGLNVVKRILRDVLEGVKYLHCNDIIHCDLKPENLMIQSNGVVKIIDFGSSCYKGKQKFSYLQSRFYRAPEVLLGGRYDEKIDLWSVGIIGIELYTGVPIFQPDNENGLFCELVEYLNIPPRKMIMQLRQDVMERGPVGDGGVDHQHTLLWRAFDERGGLTERYGGQLKGGSKSIRRFVQKHGGAAESDSDGRALGAFLDFVGLVVAWNGQNRAGSARALQCGFFQQ